MKSTNIPYNMAAMRRAMVAQRQSAIDPISGHPVARVNHRGFEHLMEVPQQPWVSAPGDPREEPKIMPEGPVHNTAQAQSVNPVDHGIHHIHNIPVRGMWSHRNKG